MKILLITNNITKSYIHPIAWIVQWLVPQFVFSKLLSNCTGNLSSILSPSSRFLRGVWPNDKACDRKCPVNGVSTRLQV